MPLMCYLDILYETVVLEIISYNAAQKCEGHKFAQTLKTVLRKKNCSPDSTNFLREDVQK